MNCECVIYAHMSAISVRMYMRIHIYIRIQVRIYRPVEVLNAISRAPSHALGSHL